MREAKREKSKRKKKKEDGRHPLAFTPGTNEKRRTEDSPRRTSLHRRTEGHGVYFCRVAAAVAGQKACGFHPEPRVPLSLSFLSLQPLYPAFPSSSHAFVRPGSPSSFLPFRHGDLSRSFFLFPLRLFLCHRTAPVRPCLAPVFLFIRHAQSPHLSLPFSTSLPPPLLLPNSTTSVVFFTDTPVSLPLRRANRSRTRASEREDQNHVENEKVR